LAGADGTGIASPDAWVAERIRLLGLLQHWILGTTPPTPDNLAVEVLEERNEPGALVREVQLSFGPDRKARLWVQVMIPKGEGPFPVFMTQHNHRAWAQIALRRGYVACVYAGSDSRDDTDTFLEAYPEHDWSRLTRRAWAAGRCIDYLEQVAQADTSRVAITGHSRNGKLSLIASALDPRFGAVISSSSGAGGSLATRYYSEQHFGEGVELITRRFPDWFHPRWRFFTGREDKLPVDLNTLVALSAPRACLLSIALNDAVEDTWAMQQTYLSVKPVYGLHSAEDRVRILWRPMAHETWPTVVERFVDWCDLQFRGATPVDFPERFIHPWDWDAWCAAQGEQVNADDCPKVAWGERPERSRAELAAAVRTMLGTPPPTAANDGGMTASYGREPGHIERLLNRDSIGSGIEKVDLVFGDYINGDVYLPKDLIGSGDKAPAILWLHPACASRGYVPAYGKGEACYKTFAKAGYAVLCYDQIGYGRRIEEVEGFYKRYPDWSLLGHMVRDAQAALTSLETLPYVDKSRVYVVGYGLGAMVGLHLCALDDRPDGLVSICGPQPFRLDPPDGDTGGIARWAQVSMLAPRFGHFVGKEDRLPYDLDELLGGFAPKPLCVVSPQLDREARLDDVTEAVDLAREAYKRTRAKKNLTQLAPEAYNNLDGAMVKRVVEWVDEVSKP
ncbi:MAG: alpha/beta fold hydrolase, partial [bacterium]|nr:alpha/beta fold hydrolase [bacterium]